MSATFNNFCISSYLTFRNVVKEDEAWKPGVIAKARKFPQGTQTEVKNYRDVLIFLKKRLDTISNKSTGLLISGGIDSAILAALLPQKTRAYTVQCLANNAIDETEMAQTYTNICGLYHKIVYVSWEDYLNSIDSLMKNKQSPLHPMEPALFKAVSAAKVDGVNTLIAGYGADGIFGGQDKLWSRDWTVDEFIKRYTFVNPNLVVKQPVSMKETYEKFSRGKNIDLAEFLKVIFGKDTVEAILNVFTLAGSNVITPYEELFLGVPLDVNRIRSGESKYMIREVFHELYPNIAIPEKISFARPMDQWLSTCENPKRDEFLPDLDMSQFSGEQKWLIFCLERFMNLMENQ